MISELHIQTALREQRTYLKKAYFTTPFKIADITENKKAAKLTLMLMSSSPGILNGDDYRIKIEIAQNTHLELQTQSYQRIFTMQESASQTMEVRLASGATFQYVPHPAVPHKASNFTSKNKIFLEENCTLIWGEILTCGRKLNGEVFSFTKYHNLTQIYLRNKLIIKENLLVQPAAFNVNKLGQMEGFTHQASLIFINEKVAIEKLITQISQEFNQENIVFGISLLPVNGFLVRLLGQKGEVLFDCLKNIAQFLEREHPAEIIKACTPELPEVYAN